MFTLNQNLFNNIKSKISTSEGSSAFFSCTTGVRRGENVSPFLLSIFLNVLDLYFRNRSQIGVTCEFEDETIVTFVKIFMLLYADDTVSFIDNPNDLQNSLDTFKGYCTAWKLTVNVNKTKVLVISQGRLSNKLHFTMMAGNWKLLRNMSTLVYM